MNFKQSFSLAIKSLRTSKMRSFLTMLGIVIGVASVIILVSLIQGMSKDITDTFESMGTNLITVSITGRGGNRYATPEEIQKLADENSDVIDSVTPVVSASQITVKYGENSVTTNATGTNELAPKISNYTLSSGRYIQYIEVERRQKVCVLGGYIVSELFQSEDPIGKEVKINGDSYTVIGVLTSKQNNTEGSQDDKIIMPYTTAMRLSKNARISAYSMSAVSTETTDAAMSKVTEFLYSKYSDENAYRVMNQAEIISTVNDIMGTITLVMVGVAAISLLVGGIGIMNIMLVSVTERTREIGIRKSIGAKQRDIMGQFVIEAATTSAVGGIIGIILGITLSYLAGNLFDLTVSPTIGSVILAFGVSAAIGVTFGYFPAKKAAKLNPIDALRYD